MEASGSILILNRRTHDKLVKVIVDADAVIDTNKDEKLFMEEQ